MVRKITPTSGGWRKRFGPADHHLEFERSASRAVGEFLVNAASWRDIALRKVTLPLARRPLPPVIFAAFLTFARALIELEMPVLPKESPTSRDMIVAVAHRRQLREMLTYKKHADELFNEWLDAIAHLVGLIVESIPEFASAGSASSFALPLIHLVARPVDVVQQIVGRLLRFASDDTYPIRPGTVLAGRIETALLAISKLTPDAASKNPHRLISPAECGLTGTELVAAYLSQTPFFALLTTRAPFSLPEEQRFAGHWIIAPPGRGKTTLLHAMVLDDLERDACVILIDSKGDLIDPVKSLRCIKDRLVLIEPDPASVVALNPLDVSQANVAHVVNLIEYIMAGLLGAALTALQTTLFRNVVPAIIQASEKPTLETFKLVLAKGLPNLERLDPYTREFFENRESGFYSKTYESTRKEIVWRLDYLLSNPILRSMFSAADTRLDLGHEMNAGKVIIINNSKAILGDEGAEFFGRFFIALIARAAQQRAGKPAASKKPCYVYIDECQAVIAKDIRIPVLLDECRSQKISLILSHQRTAQLSAPVLDAVANCAIRMANSDDEARFLADKLRMSAEALRSLPRGTFGAFVRDCTATGVQLKVSKSDLESMPKMSPGELREVRERLRSSLPSWSIPTKVEPSAPSVPAEPIDSAPTPRPIASDSPAEW
jgi:hypothetical protein